jgi:DNA mismatch endonuclease (patch repair protein)
MLVRKVVYGLGFRYLLHRADIPGKPDLTFRKRKKVIFVHGCFWHRHSEKSCKLARIPKSRVDFWESKLEKNRLRDEQVQIELKQQGWESLTIWECQLADIASVSVRVQLFLNDR